MPGSTKISSMSPAERLNTVHRLRLLRNTTGELSAHTGIQLRNNGFTKKPPFMALCIYSEFSREVAARTGDNLDELLEAYLTASHLYEKIAKTRKSQSGFYREVLRCLLDERFAASKTADPYRAAALAVAGVDLSLLTLMVLGILPSFHAKPGDTDPNALLEHLAYLRDYLGELYETTRIFDFAPFLSESYRDAVRRIRRGDLFTRLELIHFTREVLKNIRNNCDPEALAQTNRQLNEIKIHPPLETKIWVERDRCGEMPEYWLFEALGADYLLVRRAFDAVNRQLTETRYEFFLHQDNPLPGFTLLRQSEIENICTGRPIPEQAWMSGYCRFDNPDDPRLLELTFVSNHYDRFPDALECTCADPYDQLAARASGEHWATVCETGVFDYLKVERVMAPDSIYIECESRNRPDNSREITSWYRIPRVKPISEMELSTPVAHIRHNGKDYLCIIPYNWTFDVSTEASRAEAGIEIVDRITLVLPPEEAPETGD